MDFFSDPTAPKYDTVFSLLKFASAALTFSAGVVGIYSDRTLKDMKPTRLGWTLITLLFLGATASFWTEWRQERASSAYASQETARLNHLAETSNLLRRDTKNIVTNAAKELSAVRMTVREMSDLSSNAVETVSRVRQNDVDTLEAVKAAESTETKSIDLDRENRRALRAIAMVQKQNSTTLARVDKLTKKTDAISSGNQNILGSTQRVVKDVRRGLFLLYPTSGLELSWLQTVDSSSTSAKAVTTRFRALIGAYKADCQQWRDGRVMYRDNEFSFQNGQLVFVVAHKLSPAFPNAEEWSNLFSPAELEVSIWLPGSIKNRSLASSDLDLTTPVPTVNPSIQPNTLTYFVNGDRVGYSSRPVPPIFSPANLDIVGIDDLFGSRIVTQLTPLRAGVAPGSMQLGELSFVDGLKRFAFNANNSKRTADGTGYQIDLPQDAASLDAHYRVQVAALPVRPTCVNESTQIPAVAGL